MAKSYKIDLGQATATSGYYTIKTTSINADELNETQGVESIASATAKDMTQIGRYTSSNDVYTFSTSAGTAAENVTGTSKATWRITTGAGNDSIDAHGLGENTTVQAGNGDNSVLGGVYTTITTGTGKDTITAGKGDTINSGAGNDSIIIGTDATDVVVNAGAGKDTILAGGAKATIDAGADNDVVSIGAADVVVNAGAGNDSVVVGSTKATLTLGAGTDTVSLGASATATLTDYAFGTDVIQVADYNALEGDTALKAGTGFGTDGTLTVATNQKVTVNKTGNFYAAELTKVAAGTGDDATQAFAWATEDGGTINASSYKKAAIIVGTNNEDNADLILGGTGKDTIYAGNYDSVYGGKGNDSIIVNGNDYVTVGLYSDGSKDSVVGAQLGAVTDDDPFSDENTTLYFNGNLANAKFEYDSTGLVVKNGKSTLTFEGTTSAAALKVTNGSQSYNVETVTKGGSAALLEDATAIFGDGSSITVADSLGDTVVDLGNTGKFGDTRYYSGITKASAADSNSDVVLVGSASAKNTLTGGKGATSLYGGGAKQDVLIGAADGAGADTFFYGSTDGRDTIYAYNYNADDDTKSDKISFLSSNISKITRTSEGVKVTFGSGTNNTLTIASSADNGATTISDADTAIAYSVNGKDHLAKIGLSDASGNQFTYDSSVDYYQGGRGTDVINVSGEDDANIWLDGTNGVSYASIDQVNASAATGNVTLAGGTNSELLTAGTGDASLWGGVRGNDTLVGGQGANTFFFGKNNGSDTVQNTNESDRVMLYDVALSDVKSYGENTSGAMVITLNDGSKLTIENYSDNMSYTLTDGTWTYSKTSGAWTQA